ncbi:MAG: TolC family protein [Elusimicrobiales bacterium]
MRRLFWLALLVFAVPSRAAEPYSAKTYIDAVFARSPAVRSAEETFAGAENAYRAAVLDAAAPSLSLDFSNSLYDNQNTAFRFNKTDVVSGLGAAWNLYDSANGPLVKLKRAKLDYDAARLALWTAKQNAALDALNRFYALYAAQKRIGIAEKNLSSRERQHRDTTEQYQTGTKSRNEQTQSESDKLQSELALEQAKSAARKSLLSFNELIDAQPDFAQAVSASSESARTALPLPASDLKKALDGNFGLLGQKNSLDKTRLETQSGIRSQYPRLSLDASYNKSALGVLGTPGGSWDGNPNYGMTLSLNFPFGFMGAQNYFSIGSQRAALKSAELDVENSIRALKTKVFSSQEDIALKVKSLKLLEFQVKVQQETTDNYLSEYSQGNAGFLDLDNAQTKLLDISNNQITAVNDLAVALAGCRALLGEKVWEQP